MNETYPLKRAAEASDRMMSGKARFRVVADDGRFVGRSTIGRHHNRYH